MAQIFEQEGKITKSMWLKAGIQYRSNLVRLGGVIELHEHSYDHVSMVTYGWFNVTEITKDGEIKKYQVASHGYKPNRTDIEFNPVGNHILIPAYHQHSFELVEETDIPAEVLCMWASDGTEDHHGC